MLSSSKLSKLRECVKNVKDWMINNVIILNSKKTEILLIGPKKGTHILLDHNLQLDGSPIPSSTVKNGGVVLDRNLSFENPISHVTKTAFFHLRNIAKLRNMLPVSDAEKLVHAFMTSRLDCCNAMLLVVPSIAKSTKGGITFSYLSPKVWNSLPDNVRGSDKHSLYLNLD